MKSLQMMGYKRVTTVHTTDIQRRDRSLGNDTEKPPEGDGAGIGLSEELAYPHLFLTLAL